MNRKDFFKALIGRIDSFVTESRSGQPKVIDFREPTDLAASLKLGLPQSGRGEEEVLTTADLYLRHCVRTAHPQFVNPLWAGFSTPGVAGELLAAATNTSIYTYEVAPVATLMEQKVIRTLLDMAGFNDGDGIFLTGGSNANLVAMLSARHHAFPDVRTRGLCDGTDQRPVIMISDQAHYSFGKAANVLGLGTANVIEVATDETGHMIPDALDQSLRQARNEGRAPFMVAATSGTTVIGAFDPLEEIGDICRNHDVWFHVDGALGGAMLFSDNYRHLLKGLQRADSMAWDFHKLLGMPLICSVLLLNGPHTLQPAVQSRDTEYLFHGGTDEGFDLGVKSLQCGRRVDVLKLWLAWQYHGTAGWQSRVEHLMNLAKHAESRVTTSDRLSLAVPRQSISVCFQVKPPHGLDIGRFTIDVRDRLYKTGRALVNYALLKDGRAVIRLVQANADVTTADIDCFFDKVEMTAGELAAG